MKELTIAQKEAFVLSHPIQKEGCGFTDKQASDFAKNMIRIGEELKKNPHPGDDVFEYYIPV